MPVLFHEATKEQILEFFTEEMKDMYWVEHYLHTTLSDTNVKVTSPGLQATLLKQAQQALEHAARLKDIFHLLNVPVHSQPCEAIEKLVDEYRAILLTDREASAQRDVCLIFVMQKILHYKIAVYSGLTQFSGLLAHTGIPAILNEIIKEERGVDLLLTAIAERTLLFEIVAENQ